MRRPDLHLDIHPSSGLPIYRQLVDQIASLIAAGSLKPADPLPSVRQLAASLQINPMTVSRAYSLLESQGLLTSRRGRTMLVAPRPSPSPLPDPRRQPLLDALAPAVARGRQLGLSDRQITSALQSLLRETPTWQNR